MTEHTCTKDDGGTPGRRCFACEEEKAAADLKLSPDDVLDLYVPGRLRCPKCEFQLTRATLFVKTGEVGCSKAEVYIQSEPCPNDGEPMVRVLWREESEANRVYAEKLINEVIAAVSEASGQKVESLPAAMALMKGGDESVQKEAAPDSLNTAWESFANERSGIAATSPLGFARQAFYAGAHSFVSVVVEALDDEQNNDAWERLEAAYLELAKVLEEMKL